MSDQSKRTAADATSDVADSATDSGSNPQQLVDHFFRHEYAQLVASLTKRLGIRHWELVEDVVQTALQRALSHWALHGIPENPAGWLRRVAFNQALDVLRREARQQQLDDSINGQLQNAIDHEFRDDELQDDLLRMMFVCCDPEVPPESQIALALRTLCGFGHHEIARALLTTDASIAKRISRARQRLHDAEIDPSVMQPGDVQQRLSHVQSVVYLLFNEGYSSSISDRLIREELCEEAVRLALVLAEHPLTAGSESAALLALLLFHAARLDARMDDSGAMLLLKEQDRSSWDQRLIAEALGWFRRAGQGGAVTRYHAEAWIAAEHCRASSMEETDWERIAKGYDLLCSLAPSPVHELNRAIAIGHRDGPQTGDLETARAALDQAWHLAPTQAEKELICRKRDAL